MSKFKIASWNVNSLRVRLPHVLDWLAKHQPDVLALQETKLIDADFPVDAIQAAGYHVIFSGQKTYNGVAILSKMPAEKNHLTHFHDHDDEQRRVLCATIGNVRLLNVYVPNGESVDSAKYQYKLAWLTKLKDHIQAELAEYPNMIILGDFNIAPADIDVHAPDRWRDKILCTHDERLALQSLLNLGLSDAYRSLNLQGHDYSWWDYRLNAFPRNWGLRIDLLLISKALLPKCSASYIDSIPRSLERPSDHTPVVAEFDI